MMTSKNRDHLNLLCDIGELANLIIGSTDIEGFLQQAVEMVASHLDADVGSIYLYDDAARDLVLKATVGLNPSAVGRVRMKFGEGLVGKTLESLRPICEKRASRNPGFKYFEETDEDRFESFLAVPIHRGNEKIGVLVVQHEHPGYFDDIDVMAMRAIASQLTGAIENARLMIGQDRKTVPFREDDLLERLRFIKGKTASGGFAHAPVTVLKADGESLLSHRPDTEFVSTPQDFLKAVEATKQQLTDLQDRMTRRLPESASLIFEAHFMILKDSRFVDAMLAKIKQGVSVPEAVRDVAGHYMAFFLSAPSAYLKEKVQDIEDLARRLLKNLCKETSKDTDHAKGRIVVARQLLPSDLLKLASEDVKGIVLVSGGVTSHVAIIARSLKLPMVIAERGDLLDLPDGTPMLLDADIGSIHTRPSETVIRRFEIRNRTQRAEKKAARPILAQTRTRDGESVKLLANINLLSEIKLAKDLKVGGIGLYRTEFPFLVRSHLPSEEEQYLVYKRLCDEMGDREVTIRTLDIGGEKLLPYLEGTKGANPELGLRSIRFSLHHRNVFLQQLRAILRAGSGSGKLKIVFPMISAIDEFRQACYAVEEAMVDLTRKKLPFHPAPELGAMIELPAVLDIIHELAKEADFFSIGTNDLIQYMLAVDRTNEKVAAYYQPCHPSVLRSLHRIIQAAVKAEIEVAVCGEMGHEPEFIPFFIGAGLRTFSVDPHFLRSVQEKIMNLSVSEATAYTRTLLAEPTLEGIRAFLRSQKGRKVTD
ncbi:MAG: phosphoenolpyruvate--protein phosphotransferase [Deltaproteobacteria bacterium]|nr:phosphoenolpyruvate--protein phosphotransferase [Deltaproteobacteria bacterium]